MTSMSSDDSEIWKDEIGIKILEVLYDNSPARPRDILPRLEDAEDRTLITNRCKLLAIKGFLQEVNENEFRITGPGEDFLQGELEAENLKSNYDRIIDLSYYVAEDIKYRNSQFLFGPGPYRVKPHQTKSDVRKVIWRTRNGSIRRVIRRFPRDATLLEQCAFWMRAWTGKHFFQDANHRTAIALLRDLLQHRGFEIGVWDTNRSISAVRESKIERSKRNFPLDSLYQKDQHYRTWLFYFIDVLSQEFKN